MMKYLLLAAMCALSGIASAAEIRLYTIDKFGRQDSITLWGKGSKPGCHNFRKPKEVYRVAVIGKGACAIYAQPDCNPASKIAAQWKNRKKPTTLLTPGTRWLFGQKEKIVEIRPEIDDLDTEKPKAKEIDKETTEEPKTGKKAKVTKIEETGYDFVATDAKPVVDTEPRMEAIHIPLTIDIRSWQCVDRY